MILGRAGSKEKKMTQKQRPINLDWEILGNCKKRKYVLELQDILKVTDRN